MKHLLALALLLPVTAYAELPTVLFGSTNLTRPLAINQPTTVIGPLLQLRTSGGTILSLQQGSTFSVAEDGTLTLTAGNLRMGPAGDSPLTLALPTGPVTTTPLTALTVTVNHTEATGRIYSGTLTADNRTFTGGEGFALTPSGAHGTFTPAPAQAPSIKNPASIEPAAGPTNSTATPPTPSTQPDLTSTRKLLSTTPRQSQTSTPDQPATETPPATQAPEQPVTENPPATEAPDTPPVTENPPATEAPDTPPVTENPPPETETPPATEPPATEPPVTDTPATEPPVTETPPTENPAEPDQSEPVTQEPTVEIPTTIQRANLYAAFSSLPQGVAQPDGYHATPGIFKLSEYSNGTQQLTETQTTTLGLNSVRLNLNSALNQDATSHGTTSGLGRWVGGDLVTIAGPSYAPSVALAPNSGNSVHYVWGEQPTNIPTSGHVTYNLFSATQPTYTTQTGTAPDSTGATFTGNLSIDFNPGYSGTVGFYNFNGTVTMPQTTTSVANGITTTTTGNVSYNVATGAGGVPLGGSTFTNTGVLNVTAPTGALACPSGCTGTVNTAGFGAGMKDAGSLYAINPTGPVSINGAALFTTTP